MNRRYLEEDEDEDHYDSVNVSRMKRRAFDRDVSMDYGTSSGEEEDEWSKRKRLGVRSSKRGKTEASAAAAAATVESSSGEEEFMDFGDDDDDEEDNVMIASKAGATRHWKHSKAGPAAPVPGRCSQARRRKSIQQFQGGP